MSDPGTAAVDEHKVLDTQAAAPQTQTQQDEQKAVEEYRKVEANGQLSMRVKIYSPFREYYDDQAFSISAETATGPFDVLPKHHSFISLLLPCELVIRTVEKGVQRIRISGGLMHVKTDRVIVFLDV